MKKYIIIVIAAIVAAITLCSATSSLGDSATKGTVQFESAAIPALNFVMPLSRAQDIFRLMPDTITTLCDRQGSRPDNLFRSFWLQTHS